MLCDVFCYFVGLYAGTRWLLKCCHRQWLACTAGWLVQEQQLCVMRACILGIRKLTGNHLECDAGRQLQICSCFIFTLVNKRADGHNQSHDQKSAHTTTIRMAYARRASGLLLNRIIAGLDSCIQYDASKSAAITAVACGMQHMQCRWKRHSRFSRRGTWLDMSCKPSWKHTCLLDHPHPPITENRPPPEMHIPEIEMPDMNTLKEDHPELYKLIAGHLSFAHATSDAAAVSAMYVWWVW